MDDEEEVMKTRTPKLKHRQRNYASNELKVEKIINEQDFQMFKIKNQIKKTHRRMEAPIESASNDETMKERLKYRREGV